MARIEPFAQWINESEEADYSGLSMEELKQLRETGLLHGDGFDMYTLAVNKFMDDPEVNTAINTLRKKFDLYTDVIFPYEDYSDTWEQLQEQISEERVGEIGWFEYLMMA